MSTETLKITLAQKILSISDTVLLSKVNALIENEGNIGYDTNDNAISTSNYVKELDSTIKAIENNTATLFSTEEVRKKIMDANNLG